MSSPTDQHNTIHLHKMNKVFRNLFQAASYGKKNGIWYAAPGGQGWSKATSRKASIVETDAPPPGGGTVKPSSGRVIRIINNMDHTVQVRF